MSSGGDCGQTGCVHNRTVVLLAIAAIAAQMLFVGGWLIGGAIEGHSYSAGRQDISDLTALTAHHATFNRATLLVSGLLTATFALWALRPSLTVPGRGMAVSALLVAVSLPALDGVSDAFFRLDCRAADAGCSPSVAASSWHGTIHVVAFVVAAIPTLIAPFALSHRMRAVEGWSDLARPARAFGVTLLVAFVATAASQGSSAQGWTQRVAATLAAVGVAALAVRVLRLTRPSPRVTLTGVQV
jgi:hypothetical protein